MVDTGQDIVIGRSISKAELLELVDDLDGRISILEINSDMAYVQYRNYYKTPTGKRSKDTKTGSYRLLDIINKWVALT